MTRRAVHNSLLRFLVCGVALSTTLPAHTALAAPKWGTLQTEANYSIGANLDDGEVDKSRLTLKTSNRLKINRKSSINFEFRGEFADDQTGLGTTDTFSSLSKPIIDDENLRLEIDDFTYSRRIGRSHLILGKQVVAWGVLDGVRITDALNPVRLREGIASNPRPDRISLWAGRLKGKMADFRYDAYFSPDPSVNQVAVNGDLFARTATRFRGGFSNTSNSVPIVRSDRDDYLEDATYGLRVGKDIGDNSVHVIAISGPDPSTLFRPKVDNDGAPGIELTHERRHLFGVDVVRPHGAFVFRAEAAYSPNRLFNTNNNGQLGEFESGEWTAGLGLDWQAPQDLFVNFQLLGVGIENPEPFLIRHDEEYLSSLTVRRSFQNDTFRLKAEVIHSFTDGDNYTRLSAEKELNQSLTIGLNADLFTGDPQGVFGQFEKKSRLVLSLRKTL